jgi:hypothetical protein
MPKHKRSYKKPKNKKTRKIQTGGTKLGEFFKSAKQKISGIPSMFQEKNSL